MPAKRTDALRDAAQGRTAAARQRVLDELRRLDTTGQPVTVSGVARSAAVSRTFLHSQPDLIAATRQLAAARTGRPGNIPRTQRATETSLLSRIETLDRRNRELRNEVAIGTAPDAVDSLPVRMRPRGKDDRYAQGVPDRVP
jgi:hypothetical protein